MRHSFEGNIAGYNEVAKDILSGKLTADEEQHLESELRSKIRRATYNRRSSQVDQEDIYFIQQDKQALMQKLRTEIAQLDDPAHIPDRSPSQQLIVKEGDTFVLKGAYLYQNAEMTIGELLTDIEWGADYYLDPHTVDRLTRKRFLIEKTKQELSQKLNEQITIDELSSEATPDRVKEAYYNKSEGTGNEKGFLAEKMVKNFLKKLSIDQFADFEIIETDAFEDVYKKIDFIVKCKKHKRGVEVEEGESENIGVQFTVAANPETLEKKRKQVEHAKELLYQSENIDDIVLVNLPSSIVYGAHNTWSKQKKSGGPDKLWSDETKKTIFYGVMKGIFIPEELDEMWAKIQLQGAPIENKKAA